MYDLKPQARPYAKAAFLAAVEEGQINEMFGDLKVLSEACSDSRINKLIESPEEKSVVVSTLKGLFSNQPVKLTENLLDILGENDRLNLLAAVAEIYEDLMLKHNESKVIEVATPNNVSDATKEIILNKLQEKQNEPAASCGRKDRLRRTRASVQRALRLARAPPSSCC